MANNSILNRTITTELTKTKSHYIYYCHKNLGRVSNKMNTMRCTRVQGRNSAIQNELMN